MTKGPGTTNEACPTCEPARAVNPVLFMFFCPHCVASGIYALLATGLVSVPSVLGVPFEYYLAPTLILGTFVAWIAWGHWVKGRPAREANRSRFEAQRLAPARPDATGPR